MLVASHERLRGDSETTAYRSSNEAGVTHALPILNACDSLPKRHVFVDDAGVIPGLENLGDHLLDALGTSGSERAPQELATFLDKNAERDHLGDALGQAIKHSVSRRGSLGAPSRSRFAVFRPKYLCANDAGARGG